MKYIIWTIIVAALYFGMQWQIEGHPETTKIGAYQIGIFSGICAMKLYNDFDKDG